MANDGHLVVDFAALEKAAADIGSAIGKMRSTLSDLENAARPLVDTWGGEAKQAYAARQQKWQQAADDLANILNNIKGAVIDSTHDYRHSERSNTALFS
jgi:6 kDa early secretory antigenic target